MPAEKSKVVLVRSARSVTKNGEIDAKATSALLAAGLCLLAGQKDAAVSLAGYVQPRQKVGIKVNCLARRVVVTQPALTEALVKLLQEARVKGEDIVIWERTTDELKQAGYEPNMFKSGPRCLGTDARGVGYSSRLYPIGSIGSLISNILVEEVEVNINLPVLKDHNLAGLAGGMKNFYGAIHNPNKYHDNHCNPYVAEVNALPLIRKKNRLTIIDCLKVQYHGGPAYNPGFVERYGGLILGADPVATDVVALSVLEKIRNAHGRPPLKREGRHPEWLMTAGSEKYKLGNASWDKIELIEKTV